MSTSIPSRPGYQDLTVYRHDDHPIEIDLSDNTNLFGSAPSALASLASWSSASPARYPSAGTTDLRTALGEWLGVDRDAIVGGCGSNDVLDSAMRALGVPGSALAYTSPTFVMTSHFAAANSLRPVAVPELPDGNPDVEGLLATGAPLIYVASPNNPSGKAASRAAIAALLDRAPGVVILDEAYTEFTGKTWVRDAVARGNVLVTRTFSKAWGLAGLRLGYGVGSPALVLEVEKARGPFKVNAVAERAATAAVLGDQDWLAGIIDQVRASRTAVIAALRASGFRVGDADANFIAVPVQDARTASATLNAAGIAVRAFVGIPGVGDLLRVTIGPEPMMARLIAALKDVEP
jgi:histidinol-phosphate aminotransferase